MAQVFSRISPQYRQLILPHVRVVIVASPSSPPVVAPSLAPWEVMVARVMSGLLLRVAPWKEENPR